MDDKILSHFPPVEFAFAYGSAIFPQDGYKQNDKVVADYIWAVDSPDEWHKKNIKQNPNHYATIMRLLGHKCISSVQTNFGASIYFNTLVPMPNGQIIKYGVIGVQALLEDLEHWKTLYVSGRLHKPVKILQSHAAILKANEVNLQNALRTSLLLLPEEFTDDQLYHTITSLSYSGDIRMHIAENPNKVKNIVTKNKEHFQKLYKPYLDSFSPLVRFDTDRQLFKQDVSLPATEQLLKKLPSNLQHHIEKRYNSKLSRIDTCKIVSDGISRIVRKSSLTQSVKGIVSGGVRKSVRYTFQKVMKKFVHH